jgi:tetratricopeptide (TPR) repeat protein
MALHTACFWWHAPLSALAMVASAAHALTPSQVFDVVKDSVVVVKTLGAKGEQATMGSGVLLPSRKIATNCHVIKDGTSLQVGRGEGFVAATVYAGDSDKDICLLDAKDIGGKPATLGKSSSLKIGEAVYAVGAPQGLELSLSDGIVSQLRGSSPPFIQTTASISPGSSGGGLFDSAGRLVGLTTLYIDGGQNLNFAIPVEWLADIRPGKKVSAKQRGNIDWITRAAALEEKLDWQGLLAWGKQWVKAEPNYAGAWFVIGRGRQNLGQLDSAVIAYRQTLRINPEYSSAWHNMGMAYGQLERYDDAIAALRQSLRIDPDNDKTWFILGVAYGDIGRHDEAFTAFRQALRINPEHAGAWYFLGMIHDKSERYDDAVNAYLRALRIDPEHAGAWGDLGLTYVSQKRYDDAIYAIRQALRINPENSSDLSSLGLAYYLSGNTTAALQVIKKLRPLDPASAEMLFNMVVPR